MTTEKKTVHCPCGKLAGKVVFEFDETGASAPRPLKWSLSGVFYTVGTELPICAACNGMAIN